MISQYIGMPYNLHNKNGVNCWALIALVYKDLLDDELVEYNAENSEAVALAFTTAFANGKHGFKQVDTPQDYDVVFMRNRFFHHCGLYYEGKILHANTGAKQVTFERFKDVTRTFKKVEFWRK